jgi:ribonuclease P protein component
MAAGVSHTLPKAERLSGKTRIGALLTDGHSGTAGCLRYRYLADNGLAFSRILISVPKRHFKRAVKRNLLKRRIREAYRLQKERLGPGVDILFVYLPREVVPYAALYADMTAVLDQVHAAL